MAVNKPASLRDLVVTDHAIEGLADRHSLQLMEHRWTAINVHGYGVREYAKAIDRSQRLVQMYVRAWELHQGDEALLVPDLLAKASMSEDTYIAAKAIADADGVGASHVRSTRMPEVRRVYMGENLIAFAAMAMLVRGTPLGRTMGNVYLKIARPAIPTKLFAQESKALEWLRDAK